MTINYMNEFGKHHEKPGEAIRDSEQRKAENQGVTEDDVNEIKQDISAFRCELVEILKNYGMNTSTAASSGQGSGGKKNRQKERRLMKGFDLGVSSLGSHFNLATAAAAVLPATAEVVEAAVKRSPQNKLAKLARLAEARLGRPTNKRRWGTLVEAAKVKKLLSKSHSDHSESSCSDAGNDGMMVGGESEENKILDNNPACAPIITALPDPPIKGIMRDEDRSCYEARRPDKVTKTMHLDASALVDKRPPKNSVSFDHQGSLGQSNNKGEGLSSSSTPPSHSSTETEPPPPPPPYPQQWPSSVTTTSSSSSPPLTQPPAPPTTSPSSGSCGSLPPLLPPSESSEPLVGGGRPANGTVQPPHQHLPGIQPVNRHMAGGWL
ncbi:hypothetical protein Pcinc_034323 [Petrolisthes cinctipes]|uniref:Uncharacterized protein n=1 Tax=Petrolisthes cinctipes TaxID=88211 RepID=A0AAE1EQG8_PETCI|nr:hypothetical protein Pcinc_034323 [Petrolisthes cinctipes]